MEKVEQYIKDYTRNCSNEIIVPTQDGNSYTKGYTPWLTPDQARRAVEIAREELIERACDAFCKVCKMPNCRSNECKWISDFKGRLKTI